MVASAEQERLVRAQLAGLEEDRRTLQLSLTVQDADLWAVLSEVPEEERVEFVLRALKVGFLALRDARTIARTDYVEKEFQRMRTEFQRHMDSMFGPQGQVSIKLHDLFGNDGNLDQKLREFFGRGGRFELLLDSYLGEKGHLNRTLDRTVGQGGDINKLLDGFFGEHGRLRTELDQEFGEEGGRLYRILNPRDETTPLGEFRKALDERFEGLRKEMLEQMSDIADRLGVKEAQQQEREKGPGKGLDFEESIFQQVRELGKGHNDRVFDVRAETGRLGTSKSGDVVAELDPAHTHGLSRRIVIEAKNEAVSFRGGRSIHGILEEAMKNRDAQMAIGAVEASQAPQLGPLEFYPPNQILVKVGKDDEDPVALGVAYHLARALLVGKATQKEVTLDFAAIQERVMEVRRALEGTQALKVSLTAAENAIGKARELTDDMREKIRKTLEALELDLRRSDRAPSLDGGPRP